MCGRRAEPSYGAVEKWARARGDGRTRLQLAMLFSCWRKRSQGDAAKPARLGSKKEDLRSKVLLGRGCYHRPTVESFVGLPDDTPPAWPGPVAAGHRGRLPH